MRKHISFGKVVQYIILFGMMVLLAGPLLWQISLAFKGAGDDMYAVPPYLIPRDLTVNNFVKAFNQIPILHYIGNSVIVAIFGISGNVIGATMAGYALGLMPFRGRKIVVALLFVAMMIPGETILVSQFLVVRAMHLQNTLLACALPGLVGAINVILMTNAFSNIPREMVEAAAVDGANVWQRLWHICLPQVKGTMSVIAIFSFIGAWNDFLWPLIVLSDDEHYTLTVGLNRLQGTFVSDPRLIAAGTVIALVPIVIFFFIFQRFFFQGVQSGGLKM